jgi:Zn-finger nucleic acid-binding protein
VYPIFKADSRPAIACPTCSVAMETVLLFDVAVDRCGKHGIWFDAQELAVALRRSIAAPADDDRTSHPIITLMMRVFEIFTP